MKHLELLDKQSVPVSSEKIPAKPKKSSYSSPRLQVYGSVSKVTMGSGGNGNDASGSMTKMSHPNTKENIVRVGEHPLGIGLYLFDYKPEFRAQCGCGRQFGVMANEVETVMPEAVILHPDGYKMVDYAMLGVSHPNH